MNICALKGIADLKTSVKKAFQCEQEYWLSIAQVFFLFIFKDFLSLVVKQEEACEVQVPSHTARVAKSLTGCKQHSKV